eukprot:3774509-Karenia_brevis.AAC.1
MPSSRIKSIMKEDSDEDIAAEDLDSLEEQCAFRKAEMSFPLELMTDSESNAANASAVPSPASPEQLPQ